MYNYMKTSVTPYKQKLWIDGNMSEYLLLPTVSEFISLAYPTPLFLDAILWIYLQKISFFQKIIKNLFFKGFL